MRARRPIQTMMPNCAMPASSDTAAAEITRQGEFSIPRGGRQCVGSAHPHVDRSGGSLGVCEHGRYRIRDGHGLTGQVVFHRRIHDTIRRSCGHRIGRSTRVCRSIRHRIRAPNICSARGILLLFPAPLYHRRPHFQYDDQLHHALCTSCTRVPRRDRTGERIQRRCRQFRGRNRPCAGCSPYRPNGSAYRHYLIDHVLPRPGSRAVVTAQRAAGFDRNACSMSITAHYTNYRTDLKRLSDSRVRIVEVLFF